MNNEIKIGDIVDVNMHNSQMTLGFDMEVIRIPAQTGDSWIFDDDKNMRVHYVSEGCTVTKKTGES